MLDRVPLEAEEARTFVAWLRLQKLRFHHSPNETGSTPEARRRAGRMKQQGTSPGYPDYTILIPAERSMFDRGLVLFVELKRQKGSTTSQEQKDWLLAINTLGSDDVAACVAKGAKEAIEYVDQYVTSASASQVY